MDRSTRSKITPVLIGAGALLVVSPAVLYWFIHGDQNRYLWIISDSAPFSSFGSGPFQLSVYVGLVVAGLLLITAGVVGHRRRRAARQTAKRQPSPGA